VHLSSFSRGWLAAGAGLAAVFVSTGLLAGSDGGAAEAEAAIKALSSTPEARKLAAEPLQQARRALQRARDAERAEDQRHAAMLDDLGTEWVGVAEAVVRSAGIERRADQIQKQVAEAETRIVRAKALLEETVARRARAEQKLRALGRAPVALPSAQPPGEAP
jgi:colicin import membrane protein